MSASYRSVDAILEARLARFRERRAQERQADESVAQVFVARAGRIAGGAVGSVIGVAMFVAGLASLNSSASQACSYLLAAAWVAGSAALVIARARARARAGQTLRREPLVTGDAPVDLGNIDAIDPLGELRAAAAAGETKSVALPLVALSILTPLTLHGAIAFVTCAAEGRQSDLQEMAAQFGVWIGISAVLVGLAHLALALQVALWSRSLRHRETGRLREEVHQAWVGALFITSAVAVVPGVFVVGLLGLIPAALVFGTGLAFLPFMYLAAARRLERERGRLDEGPRAQPALGDLRTSDRDPQGAPVAL